MQKVILEFLMVQIGRNLKMGKTQKSYEGPFFTLKEVNTSIFIYQSEILYTYTPDSDLSYLFRFGKIRRLKLKKKTVC